MTNSELVQVMSSDQVERTITRLAHEVYESHKELEQLVIAGIRKGGVTVAQKLYRQIVDISGVSPQLATVDMTAFRDDHRRFDSLPQAFWVGLEPSDEPKVDDAMVLLVDDVIHTGRTQRAALDAITYLGRPSVVELLVLVDRGQREVPLKPTFVGKNIPCDEKHWVLVGDEVFIVDRI